MWELLANTVVLLPSLLADLTLFSEWTWMFLAPISLKSRSASYFKSFETLNLKRYTFEEVIKQGNIHLTGYLRLSRVGILFTKVISSCPKGNSHKWSLQSSGLSPRRLHHQSNSQLAPLQAGKSHVATAQKHRVHHFPLYAQTDFIQFPTSFQILPIDLFIHSWDVTWAAYVIASSCRADRQPRSMVSSGMDTLYQTSGGLTLDRELVSTTGSGCRRPTFTAWRSWLVSYRMPRLVWDNPMVICPFKHDFIKKR